MQAHFRQLVGGRGTKLQPTELSPRVSASFRTANEDQARRSNYQAEFELLAKVLDVYDKRLSETQYLAGDEFTLADLSHLPNTQYLVNGTDRGELFTSRKNVGRWWGEISSRELWKKVVEMQNTPPSAKA